MRGFNSNDEAFTRNLNDELFYPSGLIPRPLGRKAGGAGDLFPRIRKARRINLQYPAIHGGDALLRMEDEGLIKLGQNHLYLTEAGEKLVYGL